jgi:hypothetical protein
VPGFKRDDDVRCFRLVKLETSQVVVAPAGKIHDLGRLSRRPHGGLGRLHDIEPIVIVAEYKPPQKKSGPSLRGDQLIDQGAITGE